MLIDRFLPRFDVTQVHEIEVGAPAAVAYAALRETDLRDPVLDALFTTREAPDLVGQRLQHEAPVARPRPVTFGDLSTRAMGFVPLAEAPGTELVLGAVGRFWMRDHGRRTLRADEFTRFQEPGFAKIAIAVHVSPVAPGRSLLRYEARTVTTDAAARRRFRPYWRVIHIGVALVMRRALRRIRREAERRWAGEAA